MGGATSVSAGSLASTAGITAASSVDVTTIALTGGTKTITGVTSIGVASIAMTGALTGATSVSAGSLASTAGITAATTIVASGDIKTSDMLHGVSHKGIRGGVGFTSGLSGSRWQISHWHGVLSQYVNWGNCERRSYDVYW